MSPQKWHLTWVLLPLLLLSLSASGLRLTMSSTEKKAFLGSVARSESIKKADERLDRLVTATSPSQPPADMLRQGLGSWQVIFAPHITTLQLVLQTRFDVYYHFKPEGCLLSSVRYESRIFGKGHLSTFGKYTISSGNGQAALCKITWDRIWWDVNDESEGPAPETDVQRHVLPAIIQSIGKAAFIEGVSVFPVLFWDDDLVVFLFQLFGTRIAAQKIA